MSQHIRKYFFIMATLSILLCLGCAPKSPLGNIVDGLGRSVTIDKIPQRIVSLAPSNTEILFALGLGDKVIGVTEYCNYPQEAMTKPKVGGFSNVDIEKVVSIEPDLVLATHIHGKTVIPALEKLGLTVVALTPGSLNEVLDSITLVGKLTGQSREASKLVNDLRTKIEAVADETQNLSPDQKPRVFYITWHDPLMTAGTETLADDVISSAGGQNIAYDISGDKAINLETVIHRDPQVIVASVGMGSGEDLPWQYVQTEPRLENTQALFNDRVYKIDGDVIHRPGPRIVDALDQMARFIHPELFK
ncbi:MAG: cobalamin-binding protein [Chloroflexi bacterium]|nr:cobalamin-binding protein [Chloroflexota bacterium]MBL7061835.1 cobalamin-binding protein [Dehalococcoidia bacterium]